MKTRYFVQRKGAAEPVEVDEWTFGWRVNIAAGPQQVLEGRAIFDAAVSNEVSAVLDFAAHNCDVFVFVEDQGLFVCLTATEALQLQEV